ncbi:hypothetical protein [Companilactobacillus nantensis]|uniref:Uncharacterized protein n=1 Tax=Companilactobacillus nantensis DSM 16982 TaxID=1423774 RepID=A0A0R1WBQ9_9LACO|nr:hypothetical protein [Companilactobacillus nantensis]KRM15390.1 hypothetical protein FD31_GL001243 [Companilactobacillus nantensis DSM 16982]GEO65052.1 hypothetical protein LNA01_22350 [Companilactobacillus nantensis]
MEIKLNLKSSEITNLKVLSSLSDNALNTLVLLNSNNINVTATVSIPINGDIPTQKNTKKSLIELSNLGLIKLN